MRNLLFIVLISQSFWLIAQQDTLNIFNLQSFTPSALLKRGQIEVKLFNNLYSQTKGFDENRKKQDQNTRSSYFGSFLQMSYGKSSRLTLGVDAYLRSVRLDDVNSSPFGLFAFEKSANQRTAISKIGPKVKFLPFKNIKRLSIQSTFLIPIAGNLEGVNDNMLPWLDWDTYTWLNQLFWDKELSRKWQVFTAIETYLRIPRNSYNETILFTSPVKGFLSYFPTKKITVYAMAEWGPTWGKSPLISNFYSQIGIGGKFQIHRRFEIEGLTSHFPLGKSQGAGNTYNIGVRYLH